MASATLEGTLENFCIFHMAGGAAASLSFRCRSADCCVWKASTTPGTLTPTRVRIYHLTSRAVSPNRSTQPASDPAFPQLVDTDLQLLQRLLVLPQVVLRLHTLLLHRTPEATAVIHHHHH